MADLSVWSPAKVFSPSQKVSALQAKDWSYVDSWLQARYHPSPVPSFERNPDTLKALLALASANEAADEEKALERKVKEKALQELKDRDESLNNHQGEPLLAALTENITPDGTRCLNSMALLSVALASTSTDPLRLTSQLVNLSKQEFSLEQQIAHIEAMHQQLRADLDCLQETLKKLTQGEEYRLPPSLPSRITEWNRTSRHLKNKAEDYRERLEATEAEFKSSPISQGLTVPTLVQQEQDVLALKEHVLNLEAQARGYQGLPPEKDLARLEVERVAAELEELEAKREKLYDGMIGS